jgi:flagellar biosynthetic protein FliR
MTALVAATEIQVSASWALGVAMATVRTGAFVAACALVPRSLPGMARASLAFALGFFIAVPLQGGLDVTTADIVVAATTNLVVGLVVGWFVGLGAHVFNIGGTLIDLAAGLSIGSLFDPESGSSPGPLSRFTSVAGYALLISAGALGLVASVLHASVEAVALDGRLAGLAPLGDLAIERTTMLLRSGVQLALPVVAVMFTIEIVFGITNRFVPQFDAFLIGLPTKLITVIVLFGGVVTTFPAYADQVLASGTELARQMLTGLGG